MPHKPCDYQLPWAGSSVRPHCSSGVRTNPENTILWPDDVLPYILLVCHASVHTLMVYAHSLQAQSPFWKYIHGALHISTCGLTLLSLGICSTPIKHPTLQETMLLKLLMADCKYSLLEVSGEASHMVDTLENDKQLYVSVLHTGTCSCADYLKCQNAGFLRAVHSIKNATNAGDCARL